MAGVSTTEVLRSAGLAFLASGSIASAASQPNPSVDENRAATRTKTAVALSRPIMTKVAPLQAFYPAEDYHQNYVLHHPNQPYVAQNDVPKLARLHAELPEFVKGDK